MPPNYRIHWTGNDFWLVLLNVLVGFDWPYRFASTLYYSLHSLLLVTSHRRGGNTIDNAWVVLAYAGPQHHEERAFELKLLRVVLDQKGCAQLLYGFGLLRKCSEKPSVSSFWIPGYRSGNRIENAPQPEEGWKPVMTEIFWSTLSYATFFSMSLLTHTPKFVFDLIISSVRLAWGHRHHVTAMTNHCQVRRRYMKM